MGLEAAVGGGRDRSYVRMYHCHQHCTCNAMRNEPWWSLSMCVHVAIWPRCDAKGRLIHLEAHSQMSNLAVSSRRRWGTGHEQQYDRWYSLDAKRGYDLQYELFRLSKRIMIKCIWYCSRGSKREITCSLIVFHSQVLPFLAHIVTGKGHQRNPWIHLECSLGITNAYSSPSHNRKLVYATFKG